MVPSRPEDRPRLCMKWVHLACPRVSHTYIHTYIPTYIHTYIHAYIQTWDVLLGQLVNEDRLGKMKAAMYM